MFIYVYLVGGCKYVSFFNHSWDDWLRLPIFLGWHETCSMQPWRCSAMELWKGCIFLKCHVRGLSICMWSIIIIILLIVIVVIVVGVIVIIIIIITITSYEDKLMLFDYQIQHICQRGRWICWSLMKISWCSSLLGIFVRLGGGGRMLISYEDKWVWLAHWTYLS